MTAMPQTNVIPIRQVSNSCVNCRLHDICFLKGLSLDELERVEAIVKHPRPMSRGDMLFDAGMPFRSLYVLRTGSMKMYTTDEEGDEQITGFRMPGELVGLDGVASDMHSTTAQALESASVCEIPYAKFLELSATMPNLVHQMMRHMSREIVNEEVHVNLLGRKDAEERLAALLLSLSKRFEERGFANDSFNLSMSRADIGNYLGLALETVSRMLTRFQERGLIDVKRRLVEIRDLKSLQKMAA